MASGLHNPRKLSQRRERIVHVPQKIGERQVIEGRIGKRQVLGPRLDERDPHALPSFFYSTTTNLEHPRALIDSDDPAVVAAGELDRHGPRARRDVQHAVIRTRLDSRDEEPSPSRILPEAQQVGVSIVGRGERREELLGASVPFGHSCHRTIVALVTLEDEVRTAFDAAAAHAENGESVSGVLPAEPAEDLRIYLCCFEGKDGRSWLALDSERRPVADRSLVREAVSITAMCELAEESAGGGDLAELRSQLAELRRTEDPDGIKEAERAAEALQSSLQPEPRVASVAYLDAIGAAALELERTLGEFTGSPFAQAMKSALPAAEELAREVEQHYKRTLG